MEIVYFVGVGVTFLGVFFNRSFFSKEGSPINNYSEMSWLRTVFIFSVLWPPMLLMILIDMFRNK